MKYMKYMEIFLGRRERGIRTRSLFHVFHVFHGCFQSEDAADDLGFGDVGEVDEEAEADAGGAEVVDELGFVFGEESFDGLEFDDDFAVADEVGAVGVLEVAALVGDFQGGLGFEGDLPEG
jgi:hypothetical protein